MAKHRPLCAHGHPREWSERQQRMVCKECLRSNHQRYNQQLKAERRRAKAKKVLARRK